MRRQLAVGVTGALLASLVAMGASAQDEDLRMGDDPAYFERVEIPAEGLAISVPGDWVIDSEPVYHPAEDGDPAGDRWTIFFAADLADGYCGISKRPHWGGRLQDIAAVISDGWNERTDQAASAEWVEIDIGIGEAYRTDIHHLDDDQHSASFAFESGEFWYDLACHAPERDANDWMDIAETLEWLPDDGGSPLPSEPSVAEPGASSEPEVGWAQMEIAGTDLAVAFPQDWEVWEGGETIEFGLPPGHEPASVTRWEAFWANPPGPGVCTVHEYVDMPLDLAEHGELLVQRLIESEAAGVETAALALPVGPSFWVAIDDPDKELSAAVYLFDVGGTRYAFQCVSGPGRDDDLWLAVAETFGSTLDAATDERGLERVEVPEAGVAASFPSGWEIAIELEYEENVPGDATTGFWRVLFAQGSDGSWCDLTRNLSPDGEIADLIVVTADQFVDYYGGDSTAQTAAVELAVGDAWRLDVQVPEGPDFITGYIVDPPAGHLGEPSRFTLVCEASERDGRDWLDVADSLEWLDGNRDEEPDDADLSDPDAHGLEQFEFEAAGVGIALPPDWSVTLVMEEREDALPDAYAEAGPITSWVLLKVESDDGEWCELRSHPQNPMPLGEQASWEAAQWSAAFSELSFGLYSADDWEEKRWIVMGRGSDPDYGVNMYLFASAGERYQLDCAGTFGPDSPWDAIAASVVPLGAPPGSGPASQQVEVTEAGIALELPAHWAIESEMESMGPAFLPEGVAATDVEVWKVLIGYSAEDEEWCSVYMYDGIHLSLDDHAAWFEELEDVMAALGPPAAATETGSATLPIGDAASYTQTAEDGDVSISYLFDVAGNREYLVCGGPELPDDAWLSVAETIVPLEVVPAEVPDDAIAWSELTDVVTVLPVSGSTGESYMTAECDQVLWIEYADGSFEERLECALTDEPVDPPQDQGELPGEHLALGGGECDWVSDFWAETDGSDVWASSWSVAVEPDGTATAISRYAADELVCGG